MDLDLSILDELADAADVAFLVEMDHFVHEKFDFRLMCIRYLASRGFTHFGEELDHRRTGLESLDEPDWYTSGILTQAKRVPGLDAEQARFLTNMREAAPGAHWFGFDIGADDTDYLELANAATSYEDLGPAMALRERRMYERIEPHLGEKVALMAGSTHLMKRDVDRSPSGPGGGIEHSIGHRIAAEHRVLSIWMLHGSGRSSGPWVSELSPQPGTLNAALAERYDEPVLVLPESNAPTSITQMHNLVLECDLREQVDAIVFVPFVTPLRGT